MLIFDASFCLFTFFSHLRLNSNEKYFISRRQIGKHIYVVLGIRTRGHRMVGANDSTELWRPTNAIHSFYYFHFCASLLCGVCSR